MKDFKLSDLDIGKADVTNLSGGICRCCIVPPQNGIAPYGAFSGCNSNVSLPPKNEQ